MKISTIMTTCPHKLDASSSLHKARELMELHGFRHIPVIEQDEVVGTLTLNEVKLLDIVCQSSGHCPTIGDLSFHVPFIVRESDPIGPVAQHMADHQIDCALVENEAAELVGIVTTTDFCKAVHLLLGNQ